GAPGMRRRSRTHGRSYRACGAGRACQRPSAPPIEDGMGACTPSLADFLELSRRGNLVPVVREILADTETPVSAFLKTARGEHAFLLESVVGGDKWGRYSF